MFYLTIITNLVCGTSFVNINHPFFYSEQKLVNVYCGSSYVCVNELLHARGLDKERTENLMMKNKSVGLPCEDAVTHGVNAGKKIVDQLSPEEKKNIEMVITSSESGIDFAKSISTYVHEYLGLNRNCRLFEMKQACYASTAALNLAVSYVASGNSPRAKVLVIATD